MKGYQFVSSREQCVCSIRITPHALERLRTAFGESSNTTESRARGFLGRADLLELREVRALGYRPRAVARLEEGQASYYLHIHEKGREALAVLTDDACSNALIWITTYGLDPITDVRRTISQFRMGRKAKKRFLKRKRGD